MFTYSPPRNFLNSQTFRGAPVGEASSYWHVDSPQDAHLGNKFGSPNSQMEEIGGQNFSSHPLSQSSLIRSRDFDTFKVIGDPQNPENLLKFRREGFLRYCKNVLAQAYISI